MRFTHILRVSPEEIDEQGHVNNVAYVQWIQDVAVAHWRHAAFPEHVENFSWVVLRHEIDYKKFAFADEKITVLTWVGVWSRTTCERFTEIRRDNDLLAKCRTLWCMLDRKSKRPSRITADIRERFN